ncbi:MAG: YdbL family protein [Kiritimatiellia bacterium]
MKTLSTWLALMLMILGLSLPAPADTQQVKDRMLARLPQIDAMKKSGAIGENNLGYLEVRAASAPAEKLAGEENADRKVVYQAIGAQQGTSADTVGKLRARQIAEKAAPGVWVQDEGGVWRKKS